MSRFPKLTETFVLYELLAVQQCGVDVELYPLMRARATSVHPEGASVWRKLIERFVRSTHGTPVMHPEVAPLLARAHFTPFFFSWRIAIAHWYFLLKRPWVYLLALWTLLRATWGSLNYCLAGLALFPKSVFLAYDMLNREITHIHAHFASHPAAVAFIIHRLTGIPYSFTAHGADVQVDHHMLREKTAEAAFVVAVSDYNRRLIESVCNGQGRGRVLVLHCGVATDVFRPCESGGRSGHVLTILCNGTMYEVKGHKYLLEACKLLKDSGVRFRCWLVGDGPLQTRLREYALGLELGGEIEFLGRRTRAEIAELLHSVDVVVAPSVPTAEGRREGIPVALMEAMSAAVPVVASEISGIPELVEHETNGLLTPPRSSNAIAAAIRRLADDKVMARRWGEAGREKVLREFDVSRNAALLAERFVLNTASGTSTSPAHSVRPRSAETADAVR